MWRDPERSSRRSRSPTLPRSSSKLAPTGSPGPGTSDRDALPGEPAEHLGAPQLPEGVAPDPSGGRGVELHEPLGLRDRRAVERGVALPDLPERPRDTLLHLVPRIRRCAPDQRQVAEELAVRR